MKMVMADVKFIGTYVVDDRTTETYYPQGNHNRTMGSGSSDFGGFDSGGSFGGGGFGGGDSGSGGGGGHSF